MLIAEDNALNVKTKAAKSKDARLYAAVPYRAFRDGRLTKNDWRTLVAACGFLDRGGQTAQVPQSWIASEIGCSDVLILRHVKRLEAFGYLVRLAPRSKDGGVSTLYGIVFDPSNKPTKEGVATPLLEDANGQFEQLLKKEATVQSVKVPVVSYTELIVAWRKLVVGYVLNELEQKHFVELSRLGADASYLERIHVKGRDLIGYYMAQARQELGAL